MGTTRDRSVHGSRVRRVRVGIASAAVLASLVATTSTTQAATLVGDTTWGGQESEVTGGTALAPDGSTYLAGLTRSSGPSDQTQIFLVKIAPDDSITWQRTWNSPSAFSNDDAHDVAVAPDGSVYVTGQTLGTAGDVVLLKFAPGGDLVWQQRWHGGATEAGYGVAVGADGSVYVAGTTTAGDGSIVLLKFASGGALTWRKAWGPAGGALGVGVAIGPDGNVHVVGSAPAADGGSDAVLL